MTGDSNPSVMIPLSGIDFEMFGFPLLIIVVSALAATGLTAIGLHIFFRFLEPASSTRAVVTRDRAARRE